MQIASGGIGGAYLLSVLAAGRVEALDEVGRVTEEEGVASGAADHGEHGEPHVGERLRREAAVADAQHVRHGFEQGPRVLLEPERLLYRDGRLREKGAFISARSTRTKETLPG